tara:strand:+ start:231 stop:1610 length:1380 start_codon:yes stop_codon:yes gene_type:complete
MATTDAPNTTTLPEAAIQPTMTEQDKSRKVISQIDTLLTNPTLAPGTTVTPTVQQVQSGETMATSGLSGAVTAATPTAGTAPSITPTTAPTATATTGPTTATPASMTAAQVAGTTPTMTAAQGTVTAPAVAETGTITSQATVQGQLENISQDIQQSLSQGTPLPAFLRGAAEATRAAMQQRGLGASSMMAEALADGLLTASIPVAQADAETYKQMIFQNLNNRQQAAITNANNYFQMDMANLSNNQQASLQNLNVRQNFLLSDQAAQNAARQFNATSQNQVDQFYSNLSAQINEQNAARSDAMNQFAASESNKISALNAQNQVAVEKANADRASVLNQFNAQLEDQRQRFNVENQRVIDQSNVEWRRTINTANTTVVNAANQLNAQNLLNLSNYALSSLWQQWRDEAAWVNTSSENAENRAHNTAIAALERSTELDLADSNKTSALYQLLGKFGIALVS